MKLHVVSFQVPYPPNYGGVIDVYYKLKALKELGVEIILHTYKYRINESEKLGEVSAKVYYYERYTGPISLISLDPYIVYSRRNKELLDNLCSDDSPILFEGLYTCYFIGDKRLEQRLKLVRSHNIEHDYYRRLAESTDCWWKRIYYTSEAWKLERYEPIVKRADAVLAITDADCRHFTSAYGVNAVTIPCFFNDSHSDVIQSGTDRYLFYHGNLSVAENVKVVNYILDEICPRLNHDVPVLIAGSNPAQSILEKASRFSNVKVVANPSHDEMHDMLLKARINLMLTFQDTGIKLKLIHSLFTGRGHCLVNTPMLSDERLSPLCTVADDVDSIVGSINQLIEVDPDVSALQQRGSYLSKIYNNELNARKIIELISSLKK